MPKTAKVDQRQLKVGKDDKDRYRHNLYTNYSYHKAMQPCDMLYSRLQHLGNWTLCLRDTSPTGQFA